MEARHTMKSVARRTGLSPQLIRMWERRYRAVVPERTSTGRRVYTDSDINRLRLLRQATLAGESIGQVAGLSDSELVSLVQETATAPVGAVELQNPDSPLDYLKRALVSVDQLDADSLEANLLKALTALGRVAFLEEVVAPLLEATGERWARGNFKVAHEHLVSAVVRSLLGGMVLTRPPDEPGPAIVLTTPSGQHHEFGILMASIMASSSGWWPVYLGPNLPAEEIAAAALEKKARAIALSIIYPHDDPHLPMELRKLARLLGDNVKLIVGGRANEAYERTLTEIGAVRLKNLTDLRTQLEVLRKAN
ncbi:MAG: cobalamin B12-binding domain-containing protein [Candidatus Zixiibacteriota bacterium]|nr:MAG: cobalamin B12-binding domain-containing protein [candidate division Zixibacteria bacterium]